MKTRTRYINKLEELGALVNQLSEKTVLDVRAAVRALAGAAEAAEEHVRQQICEAARNDEEREELRERVQTRRYADLVRAEGEARREAEHDDVERNHHSGKGQLLQAGHVVCVFHIFQPPK